MTVRRARGLLLAVLVCRPTLAGELAGVVLPDRVDVGGRALVLNGLGLREATLLMVDVYVAGLYVEEKTSDPAAILAADRTKRLVLTFVRSVSRKQLVGAWTEGLDKNAGDRRAGVADGFDRLNDAMTDVKKGDVLALTYAPGRGTTVSLRDKDVVTIEGEDFQSVLFSIWLGPVPPNAGLRDGLLGADR